MRTPPNPYVGPRSYKEGERLHGRRREVADLTNLLLADRIVLLYSPSGAGKSSVLQAGVIPEMRRRGFTVRPTIRMHHDPPPGATANRYVLSVLDSLYAGNPPEEGHTLRDHLDAEPNGELLVFDQFEEVLHTDPFRTEDKEEFFGQLGEALQAAGRWAIFAMREDYLAEIDPYRRWVPTRFQNSYRLDLLKDESAMDAIVGPARDAGVAYAPGAAEQIFDDLRRVNVMGPGGKKESMLGEVVEPILLQVVCLRRWENLPEGTSPIPVLAVKPGTEEKPIGAVALEEYYTKVVEDVARERGIAERTIRDWFEDQLITHLDTRGQVLVGDGLDAETVERLRTSHLVRIEPRNGPDWAELAHDRLIQPVKDSNKAWNQSHLSYLQREAELWNELGRMESRLLTGDALALAEDEARSYTTLTPAEQEFLRESRKAEQLRVEAEQRRIKDARTKRLLVALLSVAVVALIAAGWAVVQARQSRNAAMRSAAEVQVALAESDLDKMRAYAQGGDHSAAMAHLARALRMHPTSMAMAWATSYLDLSGPLVPIAELDTGSPVSVIAFSSDGTRLLTTYERGNSRLWDSQTGEAVSPPFPGGAEAHLSPDGKLAVVHSPRNIDDWSGHVYDATTGKEVLGGPDGGMLDVRVTTVEFLPEGRLLVTAEPIREFKDRGGTWVWDAATGKRTKPAPEDLAAVANSGPHCPVTVDLIEGTLTIRDTDAGRIRGRAILRGSLSTYSLSQDGRYLATSLSGSNKVEVWRIGDRPKAIDTGRPMPAETEEARFAPRMLAAMMDLRHKRGDGTRPQGKAVVSAGGAYLLLLPKVDFVFDQPPVVYEVRTGREVAVVRLGQARRVPEGTKYAGAVSATRAAIADSRGNALLYDLEGKRTVRNINEQDKDAPSVDASGSKPRVTIDALQFSPDGRYLATGDSLGWVRLWEAARGLEVGLPVGIAGKAKRIAFSSDGTMLHVEGERGVTSWKIEAGSHQGVAQQLERTGGVRLTAGTSALEWISLEERKKP